MSLISHLSRLNSHSLKMDPDNIQSFILRDEVEGCKNLRGCTLRFSNSNSFIEASALIYTEFKYAEKLFIELCKIKSRYVTKPLALRKYTGEQGIVIVEKIVPFDHWWKNTNKVGMWKIFGNNQTCLGLGHSFQKKFQQIMFGLQAIHKSYRHGNLSSGVFMSTDGNILLSNFFAISVDIQSLRQDFWDFLDLVRKVITTHPMPNEVVVGTNRFTVSTVANVPIENLELQLLDHLFRSILTGSRRNLSSLISILYGAPLFWSATQKMNFFSRLSSVIQSDYLQAQTHLQPRLDYYFDQLQISNGTNKWPNLILPNSSLDEALKFNYPNRWYSSKAGIIVFIRNFCAHSHFSVHAFNEIELVFPGITGIVYNELVLKSYWNRNIGLLPGHRYQTLLEIQETQANVGIQLKLTSSKTIEKHIMEDDTIWLLH